MFVDTNMATMYPPTKAWFQQDLGGGHLHIESYVACAPKCPLQEAYSYAYLQARKTAPKWRL